MHALITSRIIGIDGGVSELFPIHIGEMIDMYPRKIDVLLGFGGGFIGLSRANVFCSRCLRRHVDIEHLFA